MAPVRLVAFDLDDTLAPSKSAMPARVAAAMRALLEVADVCVISGGQWQQFDTQVLAHLDGTPAELARLHIMPTCGTRYLRHDGHGWSTVFEHPLTPEERHLITAAIEREAQALGLWEEATWGDIIEDRGTQITFSALGQAAPLDAKRAWDPTGAKRIALAGALAPLLPGLEVRAGGSTSVDITRAGVDKAYGIRALSQATGIPLSEIVFVGDRLDPQGNDYPVKALGVRSIATTGPEETVRIIESLIAEITEDQR